jgi:hypothetical protein
MFGLRVEPKLKLVTGLQIICLPAVVKRAHRDGAPSMGRSCSSFMLYAWSSGAGLFLLEGTHTKQYV